MLNGYLVSFFADQRLDLVLVLQRQLPSWLVPSLGFNRRLAEVFSTGVELFLGLFDGHFLIG